jgi:alpha-methylacyl-CoA racemase
MGPLQGYRIIEMAGIGPGPFCGMMLADMGADVIQVVRPVAKQSGRRPANVDLRGRRSLALDLKNHLAIDAILNLCESADGLIEGFRPGVMERLGLGPDECMERNPKLVYGRITGWGQDGPWAQRAGHDINYLALSGAMHNLGRRGEKPAIPLNFIADYGGGGMFLAFGLVCGILEAQKSGRGQVVDTAMVDGVAALQALHYQYYTQGLFTNPGEHILGGGHHSYEVYETSDAKYVTVGALETKFYDELVEKLGLDRERFEGKAAFGGRVSSAEVEALQNEIAAVFKTKSRDEWCDVFEGSDACFAPVLSPREAAEHPHNKDRDTFLNDNGQLQHAPAPRFSRTVPEAGEVPRFPGEDSEVILKELGYSGGQIRELTGLI